jgi:hypothetical protein
MLYADFRTPHGIVTIGPFPTLDACVLFVDRIDTADSDFVFIDYHDDPQCRR